MFCFKCLRQINCFLRNVRKLESFTLGKPFKKNIFNWTMPVATTLMLAWKLLKRFLLFLTFQILFYKFAHFNYGGSRGCFSVLISKRLDSRCSTFQNFKVIQATVTLSRFMFFYVTKIINEFYWKNSIN